VTRSALWRPTRPTGVRFSTRFLGLTFGLITANVPAFGAGGGTVPAQSSGGQIFRAEIPGNLSGNVEY